MFQTQWPGLGSGFDLTSLDGAPSAGDPVRGAWPGAVPYGGSPPVPNADGVGRPWWCGTGTLNGAGAPFGGLFGATNTTGGIAGLLTGLVGMLQQLVGAYLGQTQGVPPQQQPCDPSGNCAVGGGASGGGPQQRFADVDVSSTGDPHLAEVGTRAGGGAVDQHYDDMGSHRDLVSSTQVAGGYRVSTTASQPGANGITYNASASIHANHGRDTVTMNRDGSYAISDDDGAITLAKGQTVTLSGGETVAANQDGSLTVTASNGRGGSIATTLRSTGQGVDVTTHGHQIALGGDVVHHDAHRRAQEDGKPLPIAELP